MKTKQKTPPLTFGVREGVVVVVVTEKGTRNPSAHIWSKRGVVVAIVVAQNKRKPPHSCLEQWRGVIIVIVAQKKRKPSPTHIWSEGGGLDRKSVV